VKHRDFTKLAIFLFGKVAGEIKPPAISSDTRAIKSSIKSMGGDV
jgi:hypothetical protein